MLPIQIHNPNGNRDRRAVILILMMIGMLLAVSFTQTKHLETQIYQQMNKSVCDGMKINIYEQLASGINRFTNAQEEKCFIFLIFKSIQSHNFRGVWKSIQEQKQGKFFFQTFNSTDSISLRTWYFNGDYLDDPMSSQTIKFNETSQEGITYNAQDREFAFTNQTTTYIDTNQQKEVCNVTFMIKFENITNHKMLKSPPRETKIIFRIDASQCQTGFQVTVETVLKHQNYSRRFLLYSTFISIIALIKTFSALKIIKQLFDFNAQAEHYSLISIGMISAQDIYISFFHFFFALRIESFFHQFMTPAILYFLLFIVFEMRLLIIVWKLRQGYFVDNLQSREGLFRFYLYFYVLMFSLFFLLYKFSQDLWFIGLMCGFLVPQIVHNAMRGQHYPIDKTYTFGLMAIRILIVLYHKGCPNNMFEFRPHPVFCLFIVCFVALQILIYYLQEKRGPRFFLPKMFLPKKYDYFVEVPTMIEMGTTQEAYGLFAEECSVCMNPLNQAPTTENQDLSFILNKVVEDGMGKVMQTPCDHKFHTLCLAKWMNIKMTCPSCRSHLPAF